MRLTGVSRSLSRVAGVLILSAAGWAQRVELRSASAVYMPAPVDSNSPAFWRDGQFFLINSANLPLITNAGSQFLMEETGEMDVNGLFHLPAWVESAWLDEDGTLLMWYHHEPTPVCPGSSLTVPVIGAAVSYDGGSSIYDLGIVLESGDASDCASKNGFFAGGHGDFTVIPDRDQGYFYFLFTNYSGDASGQGVAIARMAFADRYNPAGAVWKYFAGAWNEPGLGGRVTAVFPAARTWQREDTDSFWGPSVHWNWYLGSYVVLLNHACCKPRWPQEGIYISFNPELSDPAGWSQPERLLQNIGFSPGYYAQILGTGPEETDTLAGPAARLYVQGISKWELYFRP